MTGKNDKKPVRQPSSGMSVHQWDSTRTTSVSTSLGALQSWTSSPRRSPRPEKQAFVPLLPALYNATGRAAPRTAATTRPAQYCVAGEAGLRAAANIPVQYNATGEAGLCAVADMEPVPYQTAEKNRLYAYAGIRGQSVLSAFLDGSKAGIRRPSLLTGDWEDPQDSIDARNLPDQETTLENSRDWKKGAEAPKITTTGLTGAGSEKRQRRF